MTTFPDEVLTRTKKGEIEVRSLIDRGRYVRYSYLHPETGEPMEGGKMKLSCFPSRGRRRSTLSSPRNRGVTCSSPPRRKGRGRSGTGRRPSTCDGPLAPLTRAIAG